MPFLPFIAELKSVSMGQGQEFHARRMIAECVVSGGWVLLQNVHLSLTFCSEIIDILVETEHIEDSFRLWVTTEVHEEFPIGLLQMAIKFTNEPPQGIRASMKRSYQVIIDCDVFSVYLAHSLRRHLFRYSIYCVLHTSLWRINCASF